jgi:hypothetical protein
MSGCVLRASGDRFHPHEFLNESAFVPCNVFLKGERKAKDRVWDSSGFTVVVSEASGDNFAEQIQDTVGFLREHREELARLLKCDGLEMVQFDFGVSRKSGFLQSSYFPPELLTLVGTLGIGIELSIYGEDES